MQRRKFIKNTTLATAGVTILNFPIFGKNAPSNKVVLGVMGVNSRGNYLAENFSQLQNVEIAYICDVEDGAIQKGLDAVKKAKRQPAVIKDVRKLVEKNDFDALVIAAPDHWHTPAAIMAVLHGKHVYVEKPCGHNPYEGELLSEALHKYGKHIQMGNQRRSFPTIIDAVHSVREGIIGTVYLGKAWYANDRTTIGTGKKISPPPGLDYELWQGPAVENLTRTTWFITTGIGSGTGVPAKLVITEHMKLIPAAGFWMLNIQRK